MRQLFPAFVTTAALTMVAFAPQPASAANCDTRPTNSADYPGQQGYTWEFEFRSATSQNLYFDYQIAASGFQSPWYYRAPAPHTNEQPSTEYWGSGGASTYPIPCVPGTTSLTLRIRNVSTSHNSVSAASPSVQGPAASQTHGAQNNPP